MTHSAVIFTNGLHMTWEFAPNKCMLPEGIEEGDEQIVQLYAIVYHYSVGMFACYMDLDGVKIVNQSDDKLPLHITLYTGVDIDNREIPPVEAGILLKSMKFPLSKGVTPSDYSPLNEVRSWKGKWGFLP